jgi:hypothetical protein
MDKPPKAFEDSEFLQSPEGRSVRILSEYEKVKSKKIIAVMKSILKTQNITNKQGRLRLNLQHGLKNFQKITIDL